MRGYIPPQNTEENIFVKKINHILESSQGIGTVKFTLFMDLRQQQLFMAQANKFPNLNVNLSSGYDGDSERKIAVLYPDDINYQEINFPITVLRTKLYSSDISHKDFLGAAMSLKIDRDYMGDILLEENQAFIICHKNVADIIKDELISVKHSNVRFENFDELLHYTKTYSNIRHSTVASLRLDSVVASVLNKSRSEAVKLIKQGNVKVNQMEISYNDFEIFDNDIISIRYNGKYKIFCDGAKSRKDRIFINIAKY